MKIFRPKVFVPIIDEILYDRPELIKTPLRPYRVNEPCFRWAATIESADNGAVLHRFSRTRTATYPHAMTEYKNDYPTISRLA